MSLLSRFFKKPVQETLEDRIAALKNMSEPEIVRIATTADEDTLREEATRKIAYGQPLLDLALGSHPGKVTQAARQRIGQLLDGDENLVDKLVADTNSQSDLLILTGYSNTASKVVFDKISDESVLLEIALQGKTTQVRQQAAEKVTSRDSLEALIKAAKGKDKAVFKITKAKLDVFRAEDARIAALHAQAEELCGDAARLLKRDVDKLYEIKLEQLVTAWEKLEDEAKQGYEEKYQSAYAECKKKLDDHVAAEQAEKALAAEDEQAKSDLLEAIVNIRRLIAGLYQATEIGEEQERSFTAGLTVLKNVAERVAERDLPLKKEFETYHKLVEVANQLWLELKQEGPLSGLVENLKSAEGEDGTELRKKIQRILRHSSHVQEDVPAIVEEARESIADWAAAQKEKADKEKKLIKDLNELTRKANWAVGAGRVRQARGIYREISEKRELMESVPAGLEKKLEELDESINKLGDWHTFAVTPKKQAVVEAMEALIESTLHPNDLAEKIKSLQNEWKTLCKGGENQDKELWERLQEAADKAFEPCRKYFDEQAAEREVNLAKRVDLIEQMQKYYDAYDWDNAIWKDVEQTLRVARETWKEYWPIPRKQIKSAQQEFDEVLDKIHGKIKAAYQVSKDAKERLVEEAGKLIEVADTNQAIDAAKRLQNQWQTLGRSWRKDDQALWKAFREHCDAIFEKRDQENEEVNAERQKELDKAEEILTKLESYLDKSGQDFLGAKSEIEEIKTEFQSVGELPRDKAKGISTRFHQAVEKIESKVQKERDIASEQLWQKLFELNDKVGEFERASFAGEDADTLQSEINTMIEGTERWPTGSLDLIQARVDSASALTQEAVASAEEALRILCIRAEILSGTESPEEEKARRMEYQVQQLQQGFGQGEDSGATLSSLTLEWISQPVIIEVGDYAKLSDRFKLCREALLK